MARRTKVTVNRPALRRMFVRGSEVDRFAVRLRDDILTDAVAFAPVRTGNLKDALRAGRTGSNGTGRNFRVYVDLRQAPYAEYVVEGTGTINSSPRWMELYKYSPPPAQWAQFAASRARFRQEVAGQYANGFLESALRYGLSRHGLG